MTKLRLPAVTCVFAVALAGCNTTGQNELALTPANANAVEMSASTPVLATGPDDPVKVAQQSTVKHHAAGQHGMASWYQLRGRTACGNANNPAALTAAHRTLPCGTKVRVTNLKNGKSVHVTITDRGPFVHRRIVDVSRAAAQHIGMLGSGVAQVSVERIN